MLDELQDLAARQSAMAHLERIAGPDRIVTAEQLATGFLFQGERLPLINPQRGIFKPRQLKYLLSIRTVFPKPGARVWYDDQRRVHQQIFDSLESVDYAFMGKDPAAADNRWLRDAMDARVSVIYLVGVSPGKYMFFSTRVTDWDGAALKAHISFAPTAIDATATGDPVAERRYAMRQAKQRLHQATFREAVIGAYGGRCALSGLPEPMLLDAAHIIADRDERLGQPVIPNGIPLSKIHHAAFDAHLIGIDPDYRLHVASRLLDQKDGPLLEALKQLDGKALHLPRRQRCRISSDRTHPISSVGYHLIS
jgi:putative restriction endonuclease